MPDYREEITLAKCRARTSNEMKKCDYYVQRDLFCKYLDNYNGCSRPEEEMAALAGREETE